MLITHSYYDDRRLIVYKQIEPIRVCTPYGSEFLNLGQDFAEGVPVSKGDHAIQNDYFNMEIMWNHLLYQTMLKRHGLSNSYAVHVR